MRIIYTKHLRFRLKARLIPFNLPRIVISEADEFFFDRVTETYIAVKKFEGMQLPNEYMVAFGVVGNDCYLITAHPLRFRQKSNRLVSKRWQKIKKII